MKAYIYKADTKEFLYDTLIQENPKQPGEYLVPPNSTLLEPPVQSGKVACFIDNAWVLKTDNRGHWQVKLSDVTFSKVDYIGEVQEGYQFISDEIYADYQADKQKYKVVDGVFKDISNTAEYLAIVKGRKQNENTYKAQGAIENGFVVYKDAQFETNAQTVGDMTATRDLMKEKGIASWQWLSKDDQTITLTVEDFVDLGVLIATFKNQVWNVKYLGFKTQIQNAQTVAEVNAIVINYDILSILEEIN